MQGPYSPRVRPSGRLFHCIRLLACDAGRPCGVESASGRHPRQAGRSAGHSPPAGYPGLFDEVYPHVRACFEEPDHYRMDDSFCCAAVSYLIRQHQPDIIYTHLVLIDHIRHIHGVHSDHLRSAYAFLDQELGKILQALKDSSLYRPDAHRAVQRSRPSGYRTGGLA